jgi:ubiquinone/menaquinone biosynthesis C-methylase UbiE
MRYYDCTAHIYNVRYMDEQNLKIKVAVENVERGSQRSILDIGCGTGLLFPRIQMMGVETVVGLDMSKNMLKKAQACNFDGSLNIHLILADADHVPLRRASFDLVFAVTLLQNMPDWRRTLQEVNRVAKPRALIVVTGLKRLFTRRSFLRILEKAELKPRMLRTGREVKCHIAMCQKGN